MSTSDHDGQNGTASDRPALTHGAVVVDRDDPRGEAVVVNTPPDATAADWHVQGRGTVAADNPAYPADDPVVVVVYRDDLAETFPYYTGVRPLPLADLAAADVPHYTFPRSRLRRVGAVDYHTVALDDVRPSPFHSRSFDAAANQQFIAAIAARGYPRPYPLLRPLEQGSLAGGFEILNGHKRAWASHVAGLDSIRARCVYVDDATAARTFANAHLDEYAPAERAAAVAALEDAVGDQFTADSPNP